MKTSLALTPTPSAFAPMLYAGNLAEGIRYATELGYDGIEVHLRNPETEDLDSIVRLAADQHVKICLIGTGHAFRLDGLCISSPDPAIRNKTIVRLMRHVDFAARVDAQVVIGSLKGSLESNPKVREMQYQGAIGVVREVADYARHRGVTITIEPINRYESNYINTTDEGLIFLSEVDRDNVRLLLDTFHMNIEEASIAGAFNRAGDRLSHVHLVDSNRRAPGMGHIDFAPVLASLQTLKYAGYLSGEFLPLPDDHTATKANIEFLRMLLTNGFSR